MADRTTTTLNEVLSEVFDDVSIHMDLYDPNGLNRDVMNSWCPFYMTLDEAIECAKECFQERVVVDELRVALRDEVIGLINGIERPLRYEDYFKKYKPEINDVMVFTDEEALRKFDKFVDDFNDMEIGFLLRSPYMLVTVFNQVRYLVSGKSDFDLKPDHFEDLHLVSRLIDSQK